MGVWEKRFTVDQVSHRDRPHWDPHTDPNRRLNWDWPYISLRPDVLLQGDVVLDPSYCVHAYSDDGVLMINVNKVVLPTKKEEGGIE